MSGEKALEPETTLLIKLGSIAVHIEELLGDDPHDLDRAAIESLLSDPEVRDWLTLMDKLVLLPVEIPDEAVEAAIRAMFPGIDKAIEAHAAHVGSPEASQRDCDAWRTVLRGSLQAALPAISSALRTTYRAELEEELLGEEAVEALARLRWEAGRHPMPPALGKAPVSHQPAFDAVTPTPNGADPRASTLQKARRDLAEVKAALSIAGEGDRG